jgi:hypothetical protein
MPIYHLCAQGNARQAIFGEEHETHEHNTDFKE